ncbi:hypothetical protein ASD39_20350 [Sphingomonas sp. Root50]|nr:hypothetical protein ASD17_14625 [Sphingomonas sp. Root1294]KQY72282.1 hypothetical protein ASD39_20350 [Sphingomonas sp. Root50]KRB94447.1 hypothetical protein ASE22_00400 [Sphingomonas sp. Root720]
MRIANDPAMEQRRLDRVRALYEDPEYRAAHIARLCEVNRRPEIRASRVEHGKHIHATVLSRPDVRAKSQSPEARARAGRTRSETVLSWCPPEKRAEYMRLVKWKHIPAAEARRMIEAELGIFTPEEEGRRIVDRITIEMHMRDARRKVQAY